MKIYFVIAFVLGVISHCCSQTVKEEWQQKQNVLISSSRVDPEKIDSSSLSTEQLKDIWKKQISEMYFVAEDGTVRTDKAYAWDQKSGWTMSKSMVGLTKWTNLTIKRGVEEGLWLAEVTPKQTIYVKPLKPDDFADGMNTQVYISMLPKSAEIRSDSGVKLNVLYYEVSEQAFKRPTYEDFVFLLENGKSFTIVFPKKVVCPNCNGTGTAETTRNNMRVKGFCQACNNRKSVMLSLLSTLSK